jgi:hypothetical protein
MVVVGTDTALVSLSDEGCADGPLGPVGSLVGRWISVIVGLLRR